MVMIDADTHGAFHFRRQVAAYEKVIPDRLCASDTAFDIEGHGYRRLLRYVVMPDCKSRMVFLSFTRARIYLAPFLLRSRPLPVSPLRLNGHIYTCRTRLL